MRKPYTFAPFRSETLLIVGTTFLLLLGVLMVFSATALPSRHDLGDATVMLRKHVIQICIGLSVLFAVMRVPTRSLSRAAPIFLVVSVLLLVAVLIPGVGHVAGGARRWFALGPLRVQPAELAKFAVIVYLAAYIGRHHDRMLEFVPGAAIPLGIVGGFAVLLLAQPDFGSTAIIVFVAFFQLLTVSRLRHLIFTGLAGAAALGTLIATSPYRFRRFESFLDPFENASSSGYQLVQSLIAVGSGGIYGNGLGAGRQKLFYLPAAHTDFIFAVIAEELGMIGALAVVLLFCLIAKAGLSLARSHVADPFRCSLAVGLTLLVVLPALLNMGVVLGLLPTKGLVLPLVAYGGTAMVVNLAIIGVLLRMARSAPTH